MDLDEFSPVGGRATGGSDWRRLERFAQMQKMPDRPWFGDERDQPDVAAALLALERETPPEFDDAVGGRPCGLLPAPRAELLAIRNASSKKIG